MGITLDRTKLQIVLVGVPLAFLLAGGSYYYFFVLPRHGVSHEDLLLPDTAVRAVVKPVLVQEYVSSLAPVGTRFIKGVPKVSSLQQFSFRTEWIHKMPFEFTFLLDQRSPDFLGVILYVQEHPAAESFEDLVNNGAFFQALYPIQWQSERMTSHGQNRLTAMGTLPIPERTRNTVSEAFPDYIPLDTPPVTGRHFVEIAVNNRNGALMELQGALSGLVGVLEDPALEDWLFRFWPSVESARFLADLNGADRMDMRLEVVCRDAREAAEIIQQTATDAHAYLERRFGFTLEGTAHQENSTTAQGEYALSGFENRLRRALGG